MTIFCNCSLRKYSLDCFSFWLSDVIVVVVEDGRRTPKNFWKIRISFLSTDPSCFCAYSADTEWIYSDNGASRRTADFWLFGGDRIIFQTGKLFRITICNDKIIIVFSRVVARLLFELWKSASKCRCFRTYVRSNDFEKIIDTFHTEWSPFAG